MENNIHNRDKTNDWLSIHIFFKDDIYSSECDRIILEVLDTYIEKYMGKNIFEKFFFIRYSELGTHVRFRLFGNSHVLKDKGIETLEKHIENNFPSSLYLLPIDTENDKNYLLKEYIPEVERYGGIHGIKIAEEFFYYSSICSIELIKEINHGDEATRFGKGLLTMIILLFVFFESSEKASTFIKKYGVNYLKPFTRDEKEFIQLTKIFNDGFNKQSKKMNEYIFAIWKALEVRVEISPVLDFYWENLIIIKNKLHNLQISNLLTSNSKATMDWETTLSTIIPSYIHMMNNRLGISIKDESYLAHIIHKSLNQIIITTAEIK